MPNRITPDQRRRILELLAEGGFDRETIAAMTGVTAAQVSAISAHVTMGRYPLPEVRNVETNDLKRLENHPIERKNDGALYDDRISSFRPIWLGKDPVTHGDSFWNPDPTSGSVNPHVLILGESGYGKTYTISCLLAELADRGIPSIVFDYGQGFSEASVPDGFVDWAQPIEILASREGVDLNPLQIFPTDLLGPVNVAQRVADTFSRVYSKIGVQQHAVLRKAVLDVMIHEGITRDDEATWNRALPDFNCIQQRLESIASNPLNPQNTAASSVASHISTMFVFNTFRSSGFKLAWPEMLASRNNVFILQLKGLEYSLERAVTEFILWNLIGFVESLGPSPLQCFVVLDEAHRLSFEKGSPIEKLLREGRKFGIGLILSSQQAEDFAPVAFANTATKLIFQVGDEKSAVSRHLYRKVQNNQSFTQIYQMITKLPRGTAYLITENKGRLVRIAPLPERRSKA